MFARFTNWRAKPLGPSKKMSDMTTNIIPFSVRNTPEWPGGDVGEQMEKVAQLLAIRAATNGKRCSIEKARRAVLASMQSTWPEPQS